MRLIDQLSMLELENGQVEDVAAKLLANLKTQPKGGTPLGGG